MYRRDISVFTRAHEHTEAIDRIMSTLTYWGHWQKYERMIILRPLTEIWSHEHTEAIGRIMSTWVYWGHWQNFEHMSILRSLTELWAHEHTDALTEINQVRRPALSPLMTWHRMAPRASTSTVRIKLICIEETVQCLPEHMSILRPLT